MTALSGLTDAVAEAVAAVLTTISPNLAATLSVPVVFVVLVIGTTLFLRRLLLPLGRATAALVGWFAVTAGAVVLLPDVAVSAGLRRAQQPLPAALYDYGDAVASGVAALSRGARTAAAGLRVVTKVPILVVILLVIVWMWWWNSGYCPASGLDAACTGPVGRWWSGLGT